MNGVTRLAYAPHRTSEYPICPTAEPQPGGCWKATNNDFVERNPDGSARVRARPAATQLTPTALVDRVARYHGALDQHLADPLVPVPLIVPDFLCIHPFPDGTGRMARLLPLRLLCHSDYPEGRVGTIKRGRGARWVRLTRQQTSRAQNRKFGRES